MNAGFRVLIAEDDPMDTVLFQVAMVKSGVKFSVNIVRDGQEAINYLDGTDLFTDREAYPLPSILLLDLKMPRRNGFEVLTWIKQQPALRRIVVIVFSSSDFESDVNRAYDLGANSYLVKTDLDRLPGLLENVNNYWCEKNVYGDCHVKC